MRVLLFVYLLISISGHSALLGEYQIEGTVRGFTPESLILRIDNVDYNIPRNYIPAATTIKPNQRLTLNLSRYQLIQISKLPVRKK